MARRLQLSSWCLSTREAAGLPMLLCGVRTAWFCQPKGREFPGLQPHFCFQALSSLSFCKFLPGLLSGWFCWQNTASGSLSLPVQQWQVHLRRCPWLCLLALSQSHILAVILWRFETGLFLGQQGYHPGVPSSLLNDSSLHHIPHVSAKQILLHWLSFQSLPRRTAFLQPGHRKGLYL